MIELCPHRANPKACPTCYRLKPPEPKKPVQQNVVQAIPQGPVMSIGEATMRATQARHNAPVVAAGGGEGGKVFKEPYSGSDRTPPAAAHSNDTLWQPKPHASLIDAQPVHPHLDKGRGVFK